MIRPREPDRTGDLSFRCKPSNEEPDEEDGPDSKREPANVDLADQIANADGEEYREDRLCS